MAYYTMFRQMAKICCDFFLLDKALYNTDDIDNIYLRLARLKAAFIPSKQIDTILFEAVFLWRHC